MRGDKRRCRALLEARGAKLDQKWIRGDRAAIRSSADHQDAEEQDRVHQGRGLREPGGALWSVWMSLVNNALAFHLHYKRGSSADTLTNDEARLAPVHVHLDSRGPPPLTAFLTFISRQRYILK